MSRVIWSTHEFEADEEHGLPRQCKHCGRRSNVHKPTGTKVPSGSHQEPCPDPEEEDE